MPRSEAHPLHGAQPLLSHPVCCHSVLGAWTLGALGAGGAGSYGTSPSSVLESVPDSVPKSIPIVIPESVPESVPESGTTPCPPAQLTLLGSPEAVFWGQQQPPQWRACWAAGQPSWPGLLEDGVARASASRGDAGIFGQGAAPSPDTSPAPKDKAQHLSCGESSADILNKTHFDDLSVEGASAPAGAHPSPPQKARGQGYRVDHTDTGFTCFIPGGRG